MFWRCWATYINYDAEARAPKLTQWSVSSLMSGPVMRQLQQWLVAQFARKQVGPNSGLGKAITNLLRHWKRLTAFLREAGAPLDNNVCERALLHRKNALSYRKLHGAEAGEMLMSLIHPDPFDYLPELQKHPAEPASNPAQWMPWNYSETPARVGVE